MPDFDLVVVGGGPGGYAAALYAGSAGLRVALIEKDKVGGTCLHRGCVPAKAFLETAYLLTKSRELARYGISVGEPAFDFRAVQERKRAVVDQLYKGLGTLMKRRKVEVIAGEGRLVGPGTVSVETGSGPVEASGRAVILAPGSRPRSLPGLEFDGERFLNSDHVLEMDRVPGSVAIIGAGAVGVEFASFFSDVGSDVTLVEALPGIVPGADGEVSALLARQLARRGVTLKVSTTLKDAVPSGSGVALAFSDGSRAEVETVVVAVGRAPATDGVVAAEAGVELDDGGYIKVDELMRTTADGVFAIGDAVRSPQLAHVAFLEAILVVKQLLGERAVPIEYDKVPWCIYSRPEVAFCGMTEDAARAAYGENVVTVKDSFAGNSRALIIGEAEGFLKLVAAKEAKGGLRLLGVHAIGPWATELLMPGYLALNWEADVEDFGGLIGPHPTLSEALSEAYIALTGRRLHVG